MRQQRHKTCDWASCVLGSKLTRFHVAILCHLFDIFNLRLSFVQLRSSFLFCFVWMFTGKMITHVQYWRTCIFSKQRNFQSFSVCVCVPCVLYIFNLCERVTVAAAAIALQLHGSYRMCLLACAHAYGNFVIISFDTWKYSNLPNARLSICGWNLFFSFFFFFFFCVVRCSMLHLSLYIHHICM